MITRPPGETQPVGGAVPGGKPQQDTAAFEPDRVAAQVDADGRGQGFARAHVETPLVQRAFDDVVDDHPVLEPLVLVGADAVGGEIAIRRAVDAVGRVVVIEAEYVFLVDIVGRAGVDPVFAHFMLLTDSFR